ncbi:MAG: polyphosphate kinase 1 [Fibrobacterota bacterium]
MDSKKQFFNRELSQIKFNRRVFELARDTTTPLFERIKFLAIAASNQIEFFKVRVGNLMMLEKNDVEERDRAGYSVTGQLEAIHDMCTQFFDDIDELCTTIITRELGAADIEILPHTFPHSQNKKFFSDAYLPLLSPIAIKKERPPTLLQNETLHLLVKLQEKNNSVSYCLVPVPGNVHRFISITGKNNKRTIIPLEVFLKHLCTDLFEGHLVLETTLFLLVRNAGMNVDEDVSENFLPHMKQILRERKRSFCTRLDVEDSISDESLTVLTDYVGITSPQTVYKRKSLLKMNDLFEVLNVSSEEAHYYPPQPPLTHHTLKQQKSLFPRIVKEDIFLIHPYESYDTVVRFIDEAAKDSSVLAIKQTLYRTSVNSPIIRSLKEAARRGKYVTVLCEVKARFDEAQNINWAMELEDAGITVVYGIKYLKTHAKVTLVIRKETSGIKRYAHFGTGNYNEKTADLYTDISLITANEQLCRDATKLFHVITGVSVPTDFTRIKVSPVNLKSSLLKLIKKEAETVRNGGVGKIEIKTNSLSDPDLITALYDASRAGVRIKLNVRGICTLRPGIPQLSSTIEVKSILGRYLEHARVFCFHNNNSPQYYISSADWMPRNQERRIEHMVPVLSSRAQKKLRLFFDTVFDDRAAGWFLNGKDFTYSKTTPFPESFDSQEKLYTAIKSQYEQDKMNTPLYFEPHDSLEQKKNL